jgi:Uma2 family endonuclease
MSSVPITPSHEPEYAWEVATLYPPQGEWSEADYLDLTDHAERRIELANGRLEFLPMPTWIHEELVRFLFLALHEFVEAKNLGKVYFNGIRVRTLPGKVRLPDLLFVQKDHFHVRHNRVWDGANLMMEVVSGDPRDRERDYKEKLVDYAEAGVAEYWIIDPEQRCVIVHQLKDGKYAIHGKYSGDQRAESVLLPGFSVDVHQLFAVIDDIAE